MIVIGCDIGGMSIKSALVKENGEIIKKFRLPIDHSLSQEDMIHALGKQINEEIERSGFGKDSIKGIGIGCPGAVNTTTGYCEFSGNLNWNMLPICYLLSADTGLPARICNDANAAMLGEAKFGAGKSFHNLVLITLGTGVGGGLYLNDALYEGVEGKGGELGHVVIEKDGRPCTCGLHGCLEAYASATALIKRTKEVMLEHKDSKMWEYCEGDIEKADGRTAFECTKMGDEAASFVVNEYEDYLALGIMNFCNIFRPEAVLLGGGVSAQKEYLTDAIEERLEKVSYGFKRTPKVKVLVTALGNDAGVLGAAALFLA
ncbi:MAG: ROK family protein [Bacilli bacterium]|nr:ROK family protein [Bacilli bacterium]